MSFYEKGPVRIHFEEKGSGFPLLVIAGGGLNSVIPNLSAPYSPFNAIGGPMIWNLLKRAPDRIIAAVLAQPSGSRPEMRDLFYDNNTNADFVFTVTRD